MLEVRHALTQPKLHSDADDVRFSIFPTTHSPSNTDAENGPGIFHGIGSFSHGTLALETRETRETVVAVVQRPILTSINFSNFYHRSENGVYIPLNGYLIYLNRENEYNPMDFRVHAPYVSLSGSG